MSTILKHIYVELCQLYVYSENEANLLEFGPCPAVTKVFVVEMTRCVVFVLRV